MTQTKPQIKNHTDSIEVPNLKEPIEWLRFIYLSVNDQLKFAESKNGALIVLNSGLVLGYLTLLPYSLSDCPFYLLAYSISFALFNILAIGVSLFSLIPILNNNIDNRKDLDGDENILFFKHLARYSESELLSRIFSDLKMTNLECSDPLCIQISNQIIKNSCIAVRKHTFFVLSVWLTIFGIFTPILGTILYLTYSIYQARGRNARNPIVTRL